MKRAASLMFSLALAACGGGTEPATEAPAAPAQEGPAALTAGWTATEGIATPESVFYDPASGAIFASQIDGAPDGRDGNGRIVRLNADGTSANPNFVTGLNAPKGLRVCDGTLWTADIDEVIAIDAATGEVRSRTKIDGAMFLNDVACAGATAYVTDMMGNRIHSVTDGTATVVAEGSDLSFPNGLLVDGNTLIVGSWGSQPRPDFSTEVPGHIYRYDLQTKQKTNITKAPLGNIDGLESDGRGGFIATDYVAGKLFHVAGDGTVKELRQFMPGAADIGYDAASRIVLVPHMNENQVAAYDISAVLP